MKTLAQMTMSDEHIMAIGLLTAEWGYVESMAESLIWRLANIKDDRAGFCLTAQLSTLARIDILNALIKEKISNPELKKKLDAISAELDRLRIRRNDIVHALWFRQAVDQLQSQNADPLAYRIKVRGRLEIKSPPQSVVSIRQSATDMSDLVVAMTEVLEEIPVPEE